MRRFRGSRLDSTPALPGSAKWLGRARAVQALLRARNTGHLQSKSKPVGYTLLLLSEMRYPGTGTTLYDTIGWNWNWNCFGTANANARRHGWCSWRLLIWGFHHTHEDIVTIVSWRGSGSCFELGVIFRSPVVLGFVSYYSFLILRIWSIKTVDVCKGSKRMYVNDCMVVVCCAVKL